MAAKVSGRTDIGVIVAGGRIGGVVDLGFGEGRKNSL